MKYQRLFHVAGGNAVFLPLTFYSLEELRRQTKEALRSGVSLWPFEVIVEDIFYGNGAERLLSSAEERDALLTKLQPLITQTAHGVRHCAAIWNGSSGNGLLFHVEDDEIKCAYFPVITYEKLLREREIAQQLTALAEQAFCIDEIVSVKTEMPIHQALKELAKQLEE